MTDRLKGATITFSQDIREDDAEALLNALKMIKGVAHVESSIVTAGDHINRARVKSELFDKFRQFMEDNLGN